MKILIFNKDINSPYRLDCIAAYEYKYDNKVSHVVFNYIRDRNGDDEIESYEDLTDNILEIEELDEKSHFQDGNKPLGYLLTKMFGDKFKPLKTWQSKWDEVHRVYLANVDNIADVQFEEIIKEIVTLLRYNIKESQQDIKFRLIQKEEKIWSLFTLRLEQKKVDQNSTHLDFKVFYSYQYDDKVGVKDVTVENVVIQKRMYDVIEKNEMEALRSAVAKEFGTIIEEK